MTTNQPRRSGRKRCAREGCRRRTASGHTTCSFLCTLVVAQLERSQRVCEAIGNDYPATNKLWSSVVELSDALTAYFEADTQIFHVAEQAGFTREQWDLIRNGA